MRTLLLMVLLLASVLIHAAPVPWVKDKVKQAKPLPDDIVKAWKDAGTEVGWMAQDLVYQSPSFRTERRAFDVPGFEFSTWRKGAIRKLPAPTRDFGIDPLFCEVTDADLKDLVRFKHLTHLNLCSKNLTDAGMKTLAKLTRLKRLNVAWTGVTDAGLRELAGMNNLVELGLGGLEVTDEGVKVLAGMKGLQELRLANTRVTDAGLEHLAKAKGITHLSLIATTVTDKGLERLADIKKLTWLELTRANGVTDNGVKALKKALPRCKIKR